MKAFQSVQPRRNHLKAAEVCLLFAGTCFFAVRAFTRESAESKVSSPSAPSPAAMEDFHDRIVERRNLSMGIINSQRATLDDGRLRHDAHIQTVDIQKATFQTATRTEFNFRDTYKFNMAAYELDKLLELNMVPVSNGKRPGTWPPSPGVWKCGLT